MCKLLSIIAVAVGMLLAVSNAAFAASVSRDLMLNLDVDEYLSATLVPASGDPSGTMIIRPAIHWPSANSQTTPLSGHIGLCVLTNMRNVSVYCPVVSSLTGPGGIQKTIGLSVVPTYPSYPGGEEGYVQIGGIDYAKYTFPELGQYCVSIAVADDPRRTTFTLDDEAGDYTGSFTIIVGKNISED